jgi:uncharacterized protein YyaL (SSP411 family)
MNRLQHETSPYLLQHKDNPVDWYPWGEEAFQQAQAQNKPILLSVGYSACHWCHVMAHESFEHEETAQIMNQYFINIKVDREERPDVDAIYMTAVQAMTGGGGWPMTVFMFPDARPFYGGTYFPLEPRQGYPSFRQLLHNVHNAYANQFDDLKESADELTAMLKRDVMNIGGDEKDLNITLLSIAVKKEAEAFDKQYGGFGLAPKFPQPMALEFLLRQYHATKDASILDMVTYTLHKMAEGGIYDQIGGGFARYSVDNEWLVPHFEKMLYDNAQLSRVYLHAWQVTGDEFYKRIATEIYDYLLREMLSPEGGFYSATDADSEGEEGKFFVWTLDELRELLNTDDYQLAVDYWGMTASGNFEGKNILYVAHDEDIIADRFGLTLDELHARLDEIKHTLYARRTHRIHPALDDKILASWNGLALASLAEAGRILGRDDYQFIAERCGEFIREHLITPEGRVLRTYKDGVAKLNGYLEDYAYLIDGMIELYQTTFDEKWFNLAVQLADHALAHFSAPDGGFYDTSDDHEQLITRPRELTDNATPSGNNMLATQLIRLNAYTGNDHYIQSAQNILKQLVNALREHPQAFGQALIAIDLLARGIDEVAVITGTDADPLFELLTSAYRPRLVIASKAEGETSNIPLLLDRTAKDGRATAYVCRRFVCQLPVTTPEGLREQLRHD